MISHMLLRIRCFLLGHEDVWMDLEQLPGGPPAWASDSGCKHCGERIWWPS